MSRYVMRYTGNGPKPHDDVQRLRQHPDIDVIDDSSPRMLLVDGPDHACQQIADSMPDWVINRESTTELPQPHPSAPRIEREAAAPERPTPNVDETHRQTPKRRRQRPA